jgi:hypothetical protein
MATTAHSTKPYLLLFRNTGPENFSHLSGDQRDDLIARWNEWYDKLARQGKAIEGQPLEPQARLITGAGGARVIDGPFAEAKEAIGGYVKLLAESFEEATEIGRGHPALAFGMEIEVRQAVEHCHLGVRVHRPAGQLSS